MKKIVISDHQLFALTGISSLGGSITLASAPMTAVAKQDAWIGALVTLIYGLIIMLLFLFLGSRYPGISLLGLFKQILGKHAGTALSFIYISYFILLSSNLSWYIVEFINHVMHETPYDMISLLFILSMAIAVLYGIETIARLSEIFIKFITVIFFLSMIMVMPDIKADNLFPIMENGLSPVLKSSVYLSSYLTFPMITLLMVYPINVSNVSTAKKAVIRGYLWSNMITIMCVIISILVLGYAVVSKAKYPTLLLLEEINFVNVFTRLEYFIFVLWIMSQFLIGTLFFYAGSTGLSEQLKLTDYRKIVLPLTLIIFIMTSVIFPNGAYNINWLNTVWLPYSSTIGLFIPVLLFVIYSVKRVIKKVFT